MQINIEVNETQFKDIMEKSLSELPKEKIQEIILEGIKKYAAESDMLKNLLTERTNYGGQVSPTRFLTNLVDKMTPTEGINDIRDVMLGMLRTNYDKILREAVAQTLINGITNYNNDGFRNAVAMIFYEQMAKNNK